MRYIFIVMMMVVSFNVQAQMLPPPSDGQLSAPVPLFEEEEEYQTLSPPDIVTPEVQPTVVVDDVSSPQEALPVEIKPEEKPVEQEASAVSQIEQLHSEKHQSLCKIVRAYTAKKEPVASAQYVPGVDVHGRRVVAANLEDQNSSGIKAFDYPLHIPLELDLVEYAGIDLDQSVKDAANLKPTIAFISIHENGRIQYNNQDVTDQTHAMCDR